MLRITLAFCTSLALVACGGSSGGGSGSSPSVPDNNAGGLAGPIKDRGDGGYTFTDRGQNFSIPPLNTSINGQPTRLGSTNRIAGYESDDALALGGISRGESFAVVNGAANSFPTGGFTVQGRYAVVRPNAYNSAPVDIVVGALSGSANSGTISATDGDFTLGGTVSDGRIRGSVTYEGDDARIEGIITGDREIASAFRGNGIAGVLYGE